MFNPDYWTYLDVPDFASVPKSLFFRPQNLAARETFPLHTHPLNQFVYATSGTVVVAAAGAWYAITPEQAIWVPTGVLHTTGALSSTAFRSLFVPDSPDLGMPDQCTVYAVNDLLRILIVELEAAHQRREPKEYMDKLKDLMTEQLRRLPKQDFHLPWPQSPELHKICEMLYHNPADRRGIDDWGKEIGLSGRTVARRFEKDTGITFRDWCHKLRIFLALEWLCRGRSVTDIALDLGYASTSAFTFMFRQEMGSPPSEWLKK